LGRQKADGSKKRKVIPLNKESAGNLYSLFLFSFLLFFSACSFDYGQQGSADNSQPDIVMENVEYVRVRSGDPQARFQAEHAERYEGRKLMELRNFSFEQFGGHGEEVNALGRAGSASVEIDSGDIRMTGGVRIEVESEDIAIETRQLEWKDKARTLSAGTNEAVNVYQSNGTVFTGVGFHADARSRTWEFSGGVSGTYIHEDDEKEAENTEHPAQLPAETAAVDEGAAADGTESDTENGTGSVPAEGGTVETPRMSQ
jgi:LPS export ABC transporter protein LptC